MALCTNCGKDNREGSRFCQSCGTPLGAAAPVQPQASAPAPAPRPQRPSSQELAAGPVCGSCGTLNAPGMKFCKMCGSPLESGKGQPAKITCPSCSGQTPAGYKFCQHCGTPLPKGGTPAPGPVVAAPAPAPAVVPQIVVVAPPAAPAPAASAATGLPAPATIASAPRSTPAAGTPRVPNPTPLQAALTPPVEAPAPIPIVPTSAGSSDMAKTIIEMKPSFPVEPPAVAPVQAPPPAAAPSTLVERPAAVSGAIDSTGPELAVSTSTPPAGGPVARLTPKPGAGKATLGPGAARPPAAELPRQPLARLVSVNRDGSDGATHIVNEESFDLGRTSGQLRFEDDPYLAERHCRFCIQNGRWVVQDLATCNGVYLRLRGAVELRGGERLLLGKQVFCYEVLSDQERNIAPAVEGGVLIFGSPLRSPWGRLRQLTVAGIYRDVYYLYRPEITLGREEGDLIFPDDEFMSRRHLSLTLAGSKVQVQDLGSSNGTYLQIRSQCELAAGDMLRVGDQLLRFELA